MLLALTLVAVAVAAVLVFPLAPMALRWPLRILIVAVVVVALAAAVRQVLMARREMRGRALASVLVPYVLIFLLFGGVSYAAWEMKVGKMVDTIVGLKEELGRRGIKFAVLALPNYESVFPEKHELDDFPSAVERRLIARTRERLAEAGVATGDLGELFDDHLADLALWDDDEAHVKEAGMGRLIDPLIEYLGQMGWGNGAGTDRKIVLAGNCFAGQFADGIRERIPGWRNLRGLSVYGDMEHVPDSLFLFPKEYLTGTEVVIWVMPYATLIRSELPAFNFSPNLEASALKTASIRVVTGLGWAEGEQKARLAAMPYPNGLVALTGRVLASEDFPRDQVLVTLGYGVRDRDLTPLGLIGPGKRIAINLLPLDYYLSQHPKVAAEYRLNDDADVTVDRYWIHSWTWIR